MSQLVQTGQRIAQAIARRLGTQGSIQALGTEYFPVTPASDATIDPDIAIIADVEYGLAQTTLAAGGAGVFGQIGLMNPAGSGVITTVDTLSVLNDTGGVAQFEVRYNTPVTVANFTVTATGFPRDLRKFISTHRTSSRIITRANAARIGSTIWQWRTNNGVSDVPPITPIILNPGAAVLIGWTGSNIALTAGFTFWERPLNPWEPSGFLT